MIARRLLLLLLQIHLARYCYSEKTLITVHNDIGLTPIDPEIADTIDWNKHYCKRLCKDGSPRLNCHYTFKIESYRTMSKACYNCPLNSTDCFRPHCIPADGIKRSILVVNRQLPGPSIQVCQGDRVIVDVINLLHSESTTMHWHGLHHHKSPYMDGVPYISQCPIPPGSTFRYNYVATEIGTHFWHSHIGFQRGDGLFGPLIVRAPPSKNWHKDSYDVDEFTLTLYDWTHNMGTDMFLAHHHSNGNNKPINLLVNSLGRYKSNNSDIDAISMKMPLTTFTVKQNLRYRFRLINAEFLNCPIEVSIDNHTLFVISSDGRDIKPVEAESLVNYAGERFDFIVNMDQEIDNYWIRFRGLMDCDERFLSAHQVAILRYENAKGSEPEGQISYDRPPNNLPGWKVNALNEGTESNNSLSIPLLTSLDENDDTSIKKADYQFYVAYDFYAKNNPHFHREGLYGFDQIHDWSQRLFTPQLNHISMKLPSFPLLSQRDLIEPNQFCNSSTVTGCDKKYCSCTHVLQVKLNSVVEVILVDEGITYEANHPFHIHGYQFRVIGMERLSKNVTIDEIKRLDAAGKINRKLDHAPLKDTVTVPNMGYTIIRFYADNPGYWLFHCHIEFHAEIGMSLIFKVGDHEAMQQVPHGFPRCGDWKQSSDENPRTNATSTQKSSTTDSKENEVGWSNELQSYMIKLIPSLQKRIDSSSPNLTTSTHLLTFSIIISVILNILYL
ncbi:PREDICTED: L-ascorbate oxidase-like isoform X2 [Polistes canadensis]|uniref:L-ascorbate oxidase-like isoform X2 n=1 Tax=Polistes canadensis TaxID=91411 RepID=UPI000718B541|nr:PREDICTED: L-ascorbate oxidase-like isoform X2 [Polistes canadensis]